MEWKDKRIRILFTIPNFDTAGSGKALLNIATRLDPIRFDPHIMCIHDRGDFFQVVKQSGIPVHLFQYTTPMKPYWKGLINCWKISRQLKRLAPDIIHSFHYAADYSEPLAARLGGVKWVYTKKNMSWGGNSKNGWRLRTRLAAGVIIINPDMEYEFFRGRKNIFPIVRGVDTNEFSLDFKKDNTLIEKFSIGKTTRVIVTVANLVPVKGIEILIEATAKLFEEMQSDIALIIIGDYESEYGSELMRKAKASTIKNRIYFEGRQQNIRNYLAIGDLFVMPTLNVGRKEAFGVALSEAMSSGKCVLASNTGGLAHQLVDLEDHLVVPGSVSDLKEKMKKYLFMPQEELHRIGTKMRSQVINKFSINSEVMKHESVYHTILGL